MKNLWLGPILIIAVFLFFGICGGQNLKSGVETEQLLVPSSEHPELTVGLQRVARAKIFLLKNHYHLDDVIKLDVGMLIDGNDEYFFPVDLNYRIKINDSTGNPIPLELIFSVDGQAIYKKVRDTLLTNSFYIFVGCKSKLLKDFEKSEVLADANDSRSLFERSIFSPPANGCLDVTAGGEITVSVEVFNDYVVVSNPGSKIKTLVGLVRSNELRVRISK